MSYTFLVPTVILVLFVSRLLLLRVLDTGTASFLDTLGTTSSVIICISSICVYIADATLLRRLRSWAKIPSATWHSRKGTSALHSIRRRLMDVRRTKRKNDDLTICLWQHSGAAIPAQRSIDGTNWVSFCPFSSAIDKVAFIWTLYMSNRGNS